MSTRFKWAALLATVCIPWCALAQDRPFVAQVDPGDLASPALYQSITDHEADPALRPDQRRVVIHSQPVWYPDPKTGALCPIQTDLSETIDLAKLKRAVGAIDNTITFIFNEDGEAVYGRNGHTLRMRFTEQYSRPVSAEFSDVRLQAVRPKTTSIFGSVASAEGIIPDLTVQHIVRPGAVEEFLTVAVPPVTAGCDEVRFSWTYASSTLGPFLDNDEILWCADGEPVFRMLPVIAWDRTGQAVPCRYAIDISSISVVFDAKILAAVTYPLLIDPTVTTGQSDAAYNRSTGDFDDESWNNAFAQFQLPDLTGLYTSIDSATFKATVSASNPGHSVNVFCDSLVDTGPWTEASNAGTLVGLSFNAATESGVDAIQDNTPDFNVLGASGTNGIIKIYEDDPSPGNASVKLAWSNGGTAVNDMEQTSFRIGQDSPAGGVVYHTRTDATYYWRVEIVYTSGGGAPDAGHGVSIGAYFGP